MIQIDFSQECINQHNLRHTHLYLCIGRFDLIRGNESECKFKYIFGSVKNVLRTLPFRLLPVCTSTDRTVTLTASTGTYKGPRRNRTRTRKTHHVPEVSCRIVTSKNLFSHLPTTARKERTKNQTQLV